LVFVFVILTHVNMFTRSSQSYQLKQKERRQLISRFVPLRAGKRKKKSGVNITRLSLSY
jgi:hypothetical protein